MSLPKLRYLDSSGPLAEQVAEALLEGVEGSPFDLSEAEVWVPTAGAARRIRYHLARISSTRGSGVLSPRFSSPMKALLPVGQIASRGDREAAWGLVLKRADQSNRESISHLFPRREVLEGEASILGTAGMMCDLCDLLAEGGLTPENPRLREVCSEDEERWQEIALLHRSYLDELKRHKIWDPNEARIKAWEEPVAPISSLTIVCLPDLTVAAVKKAESILKAGITVQVLVWKPGAGEEWGGGFDAWGRPIAQEWVGSQIPLAESQIVAAKDPAEEASKALEFLAGAGGGDHALVLGDPNLATTFRAEAQRRGARPYLPEGEPLAHTEAAIVATEWTAFRRERSLRTLRRLLELPRCAAWIGERAGLDREEVLAGCDALHLELLSETLPEEPLPPRAFSNKEMALVAQRLLTGVISLLVKSSLEVVSEIWSDDPAEEVLESFEESSPVLARWADPEKAREAMLSRTLSRKKNFAISLPGDLELSGWLEAPWSEASRLALCGCVEGSLPASTDGHPFLPDGKRRALGIPDNTTRRTRDAYLLGCLSRARGEGEFRCSFSKSGADGNPSVPSALLMRCPPEELAPRVKSLFGRVAAESTPPVREHRWRWRIPMEKEPPARLSVTDFKAYLACPFRFYLSRRAKLNSHDPSQREMDALQFGILMHAVLERYGIETRQLRDAGEIARTVEDYLEREVLERFGPEPSPAVRVQIEAARVRLFAFARVQSEQIAEGWEIVETERKSKGELMIGGFPISAKIDRIQVNGDRVRVLDYKTQTSLLAPEKAHLEAASKACFPEAEVMFMGKRKAWVDLQLPLYRRIAEEIFPGKTIETAYFVLPADPQESGVIPLNLGEDLLASALLCAETVASRIAGGNYWPPRQVPDSWEDPEGVFLQGGSTEQCLDEESVRFLKGRGATKTPPTAEGDLS